MEDDAAALALYGESLLSEVGLAACLEPGAAFVTLRQVDRAGTLAGRLRTACRAAIDGKRPDLVVRRQPAFDRLQELLLEPVTEARVAEDVASVPDPQIGGAFGEALGRSWGYLQGVLPVRSVQRLLDLDHQAPPRVEQLRFLDRFGLADQPLVALQRVADGSLGRNDIAVLESCAPATLAEMRAAMLEVLASRRGTRRTWQPSVAVERAIKVLLAVETDLAGRHLADAQALYGRRKEEGASGGSATPPTPQGRSADGDAPTRYQQVGEGPAPI